MRRVDKVIQQKYTSSLDRCVLVLLSTIKEKIRVSEDIREIILHEENISTQQSKKK